MQIIKTYENELNYIKDHYENDWDNGYLTDNIYEWILSVANRFHDKDIDVMEFVKDSLKELEDYEEGEEWTNTKISRYELYNFGKSLDFLRECLETEEEITK